MANKPSAAARIKGQGKSLIWVAPTTEQKEQLRLAAAKEGKPMSRFVLECSLREAEKILKKMGVVTSQ